MPSTDSTPTSLEILLSARPRSSDEVATLLRVGSLLNSTLDLREVLRVAMEEAARLMDAEASSVLLLEKETGDLVFEIATGSKGEGAREVRLKPGEGIAGWVATHDQPVRADDVQDDPRFSTRVDRKTEYVTRSILCVPLKVKQRMIGVLEVLNKRAGVAFTENDEEFLGVLSHQIAAAIDNAQLYKQAYEEKETLRAVLDSMADAVLVLDAQDRILLHNPALLDLLDVAAGDLCLSRFGEGGIWGAADRESCEATRTLSYNLAVDRGGSRHTLANTATVLTEPSGAVSGSVMVMRDVTEQARLERMKNDFIATTSHKLRTPLTAILSYASLLRNKGFRGGGGEGEEDIVSEGAAVIEEQSRYLHELIEKLLAFSGMEMENLEIEKAPGDAARLLEKACEAVRGCSCTNAREAQITWRKPAEALEVRMDEPKMLQVMRNLLENAVKFSPPGSPVTLGAESAGAEVRFWVSDKGPGIPADEKDRIFEKFYQIDRDLTGQVEGVGLGLALCRNIVLAHGGRIEVESEPGQGSTFGVYLPK